MRCVTCGHPVTEVIDTRLAVQNNAVRRRRSCKRCGARWTTYERDEEADLRAAFRVVKASVVESLKED